MGNTTLYYAHWKLHPCYSVHLSGYLWTQKDDLLLGSKRETAVKRKVNLSQASEEKTDVKTYNWGSERIPNPLRLPIYVAENGLAAVCFRWPPVQERLLWYAGHGGWRTKELVMAAITCARDWKGEQFDCRWSSEAHWRLLLRQLLQWGCSKWELGTSEASRRQRYQQSYSEGRALRRWFTQKGCEAGHCRLGGDWREWRHCPQQIQE